MRKVDKKIAIRKITFSALFLALALIVSVLENMIPPLIPVLPYAKIGLCNIVLLMCFLLVGVWEGYIVLVIKCILAAVFAGNMGMLIWSLPAALISYTVMVGLYYAKIFSTTGISVAGGLIHNMVQMFVGAIVVGASILTFMPYMMLAGGIAGLITGILCHVLVETLKDKINPPIPVEQEDEVQENIES